MWRCNRMKSLIIVELKKTKEKQLHESKVLVSFHYFVCYFYMLCYYNDEQWTCLCLKLLSHPSQAIHLLTTCLFIHWLLFFSSSEKSKSLHLCHWKKREKKEAESILYSCPTNGKCEANVPQWIDFYNQIDIYFLVNIFSLCILVFCIHSCEHMWVTSSKGQGKLDRSLVERERSNFTGALPGSL